MSFYLAMKKNYLSCIWFLIMFSTDNIDMMTKLLLTKYMTM